MAWLLDRPSPPRPSAIEAGYGECVPSRKSIEATTTPLAASASTHARTDALGGGEGQDDRFALACGPEEAADWLHCLDELGYDDVGLVRLGHTEADLTEGDLWQIRALVPRGQVEQ